MFSLHNIHYECCINPYFFLYVICTRDTGKESEGVYEEYLNYFVAYDVVRVSQQGVCSRNYAMPAAVVIMLQLLIENQTKSRVHPI